MKPEMSNHPNNFPKTKSVRYKHVIGCLLLVIVAWIELIDQARAAAATTTTLRNEHSGRKTEANSTERSRTRRKSSPLETARRPKSPLAPALRLNEASTRTSNANNNQDYQVDKRDYYDSIQPIGNGPDDLSPPTSLAADGTSLNGEHLSLSSSRTSEPELSFNLLSSAQDRIAAVKNLLQNQTTDPTRNDAPSSQNSNNNSTTINQYSGSCNHKGRVYANGQHVPIEDQPCLSCTCLRSIMQCFLRVCPPVVSASSSSTADLNSHKKLIGPLPNAAPLKCRMVKEPSQCCPTMKCEEVDQEQSTSTISTTVASAQTTLESPPSTRNMTATRTSARNADSTRRASNETQASQPIDSSLEDSILLITSNPAHHQQAHAHLNNLTSESLALHRSLSQKPASRYDYSSGLLDALIESAYSNAAQMSGLNVAGSCLINGSLYVEGSAVLTEANSYCQFCYCIRQKIMCVRPKCHLYISGCKPKYGSEYACCPTSYECGSSSNLPHESGNLTTGNEQRMLPLAGRQHSSAGSSKELVGKISAALESISRLTQMERSHNAEVSKRQDGDTLMEAIMRTVEQSEPDSPSSSSNSEISERTKENNETTTTPTTTSSPSTTSLAVDESELAKNSTLRPPTTESIPTTTSMTTTPGGGEDELLEPMNKLGPHMTQAQTGGLGGCLEKGRHYEIGEQIPTLDRCKHCYCGLEGTKECKIVECGLKMAHDCRPIIPKDHCCPIRYECPSSHHHLNGTASPISGASQHNQAHFNHNRTQLTQRNNLADSLREAMNRYRSEQLPVELPQDQQGVTDDHNQFAATTSTPGSLVDAAFVTQCSLLANPNSSLPLCNPPGQQGGPSSPPNVLVPSSPANAGRQAQAGVPFKWPTPTGPLEVIPGLGYYGAGESSQLMAGPPTPKSTGEPRLLEDRQQQQEQQQQEENLGSSSGQQSALSVTALNEMLENFTRSQGNLNSSGTGGGETTTVQPEFLQPANLAKPMENSTVDSANMTNLSDDLNKFIMNINLQQQQPNGTNNEQQDPTRAPLSPVAARNQQPRMAADYHSVQAEPDQLLHNLSMTNESGGSQSPQMEPQAMGIPSIEPELIRNLGLPDHLALVNRNAQANNEATDYMTTRHIINESADYHVQPRDSHQADRLTESFVEYANRQEEPTTMTTPTSSGGGDNQDYLPDSYNSGAIPQPKPKIRFASTTSQPETGSTTVIFDDDATHNSSASMYRSIAGATHSASTSSPDHSTSTSASIIPLQDDHYDSTPFPPQPSTGTPLGFPTTTEASASASGRDKGWFRSLAGAVANSFGRRLNGNPINTANSIRSEPLESATSDDSPNNAREAATARSTGQAILKQLLEKFVSSAEPASPECSQASFSGRSMGAENTGLIMRPLQVSQPAAPSVRPDPMGANLHADLNLSSGSELATTSTPFTTETSINEQSDNNNNNLEAQPTFTHRTLQQISSNLDSYEPNNGNQDEQQGKSMTSVGGSNINYESIADGKSVMVSGEQQAPIASSISSGKHMLTSDARLAASCLDPSTNITYLSGEKMPRTDNCLACTCVSGEPLCSPLVCPPKPAENCYEDRGAHVGECCPSYVCTDNASQLRPQHQVIVDHQQIRNAHSNKHHVGHHSARMMTQSTNQQQPNNLVPSSSRVELGPIPNFGQSNSPQTSFQINNQPFRLSNNNQLAPNNPLISTTGLFRSLPAHLRYPPQRNAPILPNLVAAQSVPINNKVQQTLNNARFPTRNLVAINDNTNLLWPNEDSNTNTNNNNNYHYPINRRLQSNANRILAASDILANRQIVTHPTTLRQPQINQESRNPIWWNALVQKPTSQPLTTTTTAIPSLHSTNDNYHHQLQQRQHQEPKLVSNGLSGEPLKESQGGQFSPLADSVDSAAFRPLAKPVAGPLPSNNIAIELPANVVMPSLSANEDVDKPIFGKSRVEEKPKEAETVQNDENSEDQMSLTSNPFQVSRCDVSGKLYIIGETIESLSSRCKHCVCTPIGVDCQSRLC